MSPKKSKRADGYEADTDDTLRRRNIRRKSVRELAGMFQNAENACPSPLPLRPKQFPGCADSDYDSGEFWFVIIFIYVTPCHFYSILLDVETV